jgi:xanthine/uracil permease
MKKLALPLIIACTWAVVALKILLGAIQTHQPGKITAAAIGTAIACGFALLLVHRVMQLRTKQPAG